MSNFYNGIYRRVINWFKGRNDGYYYNPRTLTPNQKKWIDRYIRLSGDDRQDYHNPPDEYHIVYEWENGWIDFTEMDDTFWIWTLYSHREGDKNPSIDGLDKGNGGDAIKMAAKMARERGYTTIDWDTHRKPEAWKKATKEEGNLKVVSSQIRINLFEKRLDIDS